MSWELIRAIQKQQPDLQLVLPFGLTLQVGDVVTISKKNGTITIEGNCFALLGERPPKATAPGAPVELLVQYGKDLKIQFRTAGNVPPAFPDAPTGKAGFDISMKSSNSVVLAAVGRSLTASTDVARFREPILKAYRRGVWSPDHALITSVATVEKMTLLASQSSDTQVALSVSGNATVGMPTAIDLTAEASLLALNKAIIQSITSTRTTAFCSGLRVHESWFGTPSIHSLDAIEAKDPGRLFWERFDSGFGNVSI